MPTPEDSPPTRFGSLVGRYGRRSLIVLAIIVAAGFLLRAWFVFNPDPDPGDDAFAYRALAESLYQDRSFGGPGFETPSDWSPGAPLIYAGSYFLTGGVRDGVARGVEALFGTGTILIAFFLTSWLICARGRSGRESEGPEDARIDGRSGIERAAPLLAAGLVAFYPPFASAAGALMSEPPATFALPAAILAFLWADSRRQIWPWLIPGLLLGLTTLIRPEYMAVTAALGLVLFFRLGITVRWRQALPAGLTFGLAALVVVLPWTIRNYEALDRVVPVSTGSGKALFTGTYLPADGEYKRVKAALLEQQTGRRLEPGSKELEAIDPVPLFDREAERYPDLDRDAALGKIGRENLNRYLKEDPVGYAAMTLRKAGRMWGSSSSGFMASGFGALIHLALVLAGFAGLILLARRRQFAAIVLAMPILGITAIGALTLAPPRRNEILMALILPLAAIAVSALWDLVARRIRPVPAERPDKRPPVRAESRPQT